MNSNKISGENTNSVPIYLRLTQTLRERIRNGTYARTGKLESENELCSMFDCSRPTVRKALSTLISEGHIRKYPKKGYFLNKTRPQEKKQPQTIAVIANLGNDLTNFQSYPLLVQLNNLADTYGFQLQFLYFNEVKDVLHYLLHYPEGLSAALMFRPPQDWVEALVKNGKRLLKKGLPFIVIDRNLKDTGIHYCTSDFAQPVRDGLKYLSQLGHRRVGLILGDVRTVYNIDIYHSYKENVKKYGLEYDPSLLCEIKAPDFSSMSKTINKFLSPPLSFSSFIVTGGYYLHDTLSILDRKGIKVPRDVSMILNCQTHFIQNLDLNITVFQQPIYEVCKRCFETFTIMIEGKFEGIFQETIPFPFVFGDTCAPLIQ